MSEVTVDWILSELREKCQGQGWEISSGRIRNENSQCPLCALATVRGENPLGQHAAYWRTTLPDMNYDHEIYHSIAYAADEVFGKFRFQLMKALGIEYKLGA